MKITNKKYSLFPSGYKRTNTAVTKQERGWERRYVKEILEEEDNHDITRLNVSSYGDEFRSMLGMK